MSKELIEELKESRDTYISYCQEEIAVLLDRAIEALTQQQEAEPVTVERFTEDGLKAIVTGIQVCCLDIGDKLYKHPPAAQPQVVQGIMNAGTLGAEFEQALMKNLSSPYECGDKSPAAQPPEWKPACGCRFENDSSNAVVLCESCSALPCHNPPGVSAAQPHGWRQVIDRVMESIGAGDHRDRKMASAEAEAMRPYIDAIVEGIEDLEQAAQPQVPEGALRIDLALSDKRISKMLWVSEVRSSNMKLVAYCADEAWQELSAAKEESCQK